MVRAINAHDVITGQVKYFEFAGEHDDSKPTQGVATGSTFLEVDTGDVYAYSEASAAWNKICALGGDGT